MSAQGRIEAESGPIPVLALAVGAVLMPFRLSRRTSGLEVHRRSLTPDPVAR